ncbi:MAG: hypothetical protein ABR567_03025 [Myxococcales bacterium]|nr:hypothetical protein [Myxococcales bacterium]
MTRLRLCLAVLAIAAAALADDTRAVVHLKDGSVVRGTVKRIRLGKSITLSLPSGKTATYDDPEIVNIEIAGGAAPAAGQPAPPSPKPPPLPSAAPTSDLDTVYLNDGGFVRGYIESDKPDVVIRLLSGKKRNYSPKDVKLIERHAKKP